MIDPYVAFAPSLAGPSFLHESRGFEETQRRRIVAENPCPHAVDAFFPECEIQCQRYRVPAEPLPLLRRIDQDAEFGGRIALPVRFDGDMAYGFSFRFDDEGVTGPQDTAELGVWIEIPAVPPGQ